jgi:hypothetical protein
MNEKITPNPAPLRKSLATLALWIFIAGLFVYVIVALGTYSDLKKKNHLMSETLAEVTESKGGIARGTGGKTQTSATIRYRYAVNGQQFEDSSIKTAGDTSAYYPVGKNTAKVCYDAQNPQDSEVYPLNHVCGDISTNIWQITGGFIVMMSLCFLIGSAIILIYRTFRGKRNLQS